MLALTKNKSLAALSLILFELTTSMVLAQAHPPASSITGATLDRYREMYQQSPLCTKAEITLWSCETKNRVFSLCSSPVVTRTTGYLQYRASNAGKLSFSYPGIKTTPLGLFKYKSSGNGNASIEFTNNGYRYTLEDPLRDKSSIVVLATSEPKKEIEIACGPNQTLQVNYTMHLMYDSGLWEGN